MFKRGDGRGFPTGIGLGGSSTNGAKSASLWRRRSSCADGAIERTPTGSMRRRSHGRAVTRITRGSAKLIADLGWYRSAATGDQVRIADTRLRPAGEATDARTTPRKRPEANHGRGSHIDACAMAYRRFGASLPLTRSSDRVSPPSARPGRHAACLRAVDRGHERNPPQDTAASHRSSK